MKTYKLKVKFGGYNSFNMNNISDAELSDIISLFEDRLEQLDGFEVLPESLKSEDLPTL